MVFRWEGLAVACEDEGTLIHCSLRELGGVHIVANRGFEGSLYSFSSQLMDRVV